MRRLTLTVLAACGLAALTGASATASSPPHPARMMVYAQEWSLWDSRAALPHGKVIVQLWNRGQDAHDLRIRRLDRHGRLVGHAQGVAVTVSGSRSQATWRLSAGRYELYCSMPGHRQNGMHAVLLVH